MTTTTQTIPTSTLAILPKPGRAFRGILWAAQVLLALVFGVGGATKAFVPLDHLPRLIPWTSDVPSALVRFIGTMELLGCVGLVLPSLLRIRPRLTPFAASGLVVVMTLASGFHALRHEPTGIVVNAVLGALAAFVAWGRFRVAPIEGRS